MAASAKDIEPSSSSTSRVGARGFPEALLAAPAEARMEYFRLYHVAHPRLVEVDRDVDRLVANPGDTAIILIVGPSGVGKTTLKRHLVKRLEERYLPEMQADPSFVPVVAVDAMASEKGLFNWTEYFVRALNQLQEPILEVAGSLNVEQTLQRLERRRRTSPAMLRIAYERAIIRRRIRAIFTDEAQHILKVGGSGRRVQDQLDYLKSLSDTSAPHVLLGTYDLLALLDLNGQIARRSELIDFSRYTLDESDTKAFVRTVRAFERHLPVQDPPNLVDQWEFLYERSIGCVGVLKQWLSRVLADALEDGGAITEGSLRRRAPSMATAQRMIIDAQRGEVSLREENPERLRTLLGLERTGETAASAPHRPRRQPGRRSPVRDPVGIPHVG